MSFIVNAPKKKIPESEYFRVVKLCHVYFCLSIKSVVKLGLSYVLVKFELSYVLVIDWQTRTMNIYYTVEKIMLHFYEQSGIKGKAVHSNVCRESQAHTRSKQHCITALDGDKTWVIVTVNTRRICTVFVVAMMNMR